MANEGSREEPLSASIGEQLQEKQQVEAQASAGREAAEQEEERIERHKAEDRAEVMSHVGAEGWSARRARARERGRTLARVRDLAGTVLPALGVAVITVALVGGRRRLALLGLPLLGGILVLRNRLPVR